MRPRGTLRRAKPMRRVSREQPTPRARRRDQREADASACGQSSSLGALRNPDPLAAMLVAIRDVRSRQAMCAGVVSSCRRRGSAVMNGDKQGPRLTGRRDGPLA